MTTETAHWSTGPLHAALVNWLPTFVKEPFSAAPKLNIRKLEKALALSHGAVHHWLRKDKVSARHVQPLIELANSKDNLDVLRQFGRKPPKIVDIFPFVFA